jgi:hypothetical protein
MKFFTGVMYVMYDGREFPAIRFYEAENEAHALSLQHEGARTWVSDEQPEIDGKCYWFEAQAWLVYPLSVREISDATYREMQQK